ncbi:hypothetical protein [Rhizobium leguminosarum]
MISSTLKSLYAIEGSSDSEKIEGIRLALIDFLETERQELETNRSKPVA